MFHVKASECIKDVSTFVMHLDFCQESRGFIASYVKSSESPKVESATSTVLRRRSRIPTYTSATQPANSEYQSSYIVVYRLYVSSHNKLSTKCKTPFSLMIKIYDGGTCYIII